MTKREELDALLSARGVIARSHDDEPLFILVGRDQLAPKAVRLWCRLAGNAGVNAAKIAEAQELADRMDAWQAAHGGGKLPD